MIRMRPLLVMIGVLLGLALPAAAGDLVVRVEGVRNADGFVRALVFSSEKGFPEEVKLATAAAEARAKAGVVTLRFKDLKVKRGAIIVIHDANNDRKLQKNLLGIPREGVGASNWNKAGRPKFKNAVINFAGGKAVTVKLKYF